jgi:hypothetical protein
MHFIYLDESGDPGVVNSPTSFYILAGLSVHHSDWQALDQRIQSFRDMIEREYGFSANKELHTSEFLGSGFKIGGLNRPTRLLIAQKLVCLLAESPEIRVFAWAIRKTTFHPLAIISEHAMLDLHEWVTSQHIHKPNSCDHQGFYIVHDETSNPPFHTTTRPLTLVGRPSCNPSRDSHFIQIADFIAYLVKQRVAPGRHVKESQLLALSDGLAPVSLGWRILA